MKREQLISKYLKLEKRSNILFVMGYALMFISFLFIMSVLLIIEAIFFFIPFSIGVCACLYATKYRDKVYNMFEKEIEEVDE